MSKALREHVGITPCVQFACRKADYCAESRSACSAFAFYVISGRCCHPNLDFGDIADVQDTRAAKVKPVTRDEPMPTPEIYRRLFRAGVDA